MKYVLEDMLTKDLLLNNGFKKINCSKNAYDYVYIKYLIKDIYMCVSINERDGIMTFDSIKIIDDNFGRLYEPFYKNKKFKAVDIVREKYQNEIDNLINLGIFKSNNKVLKKEMK